MRRHGLGFGGYGRLVAGVVVGAAGWLMLLGAATGALADSAGSAATGASGVALAAQAPGSPLLSGPLEGGSVDASDQAVPVVSTPVGVSASSSRSLYAGMSANGAAGLAAQVFHVVRPPVVRSIRFVSA